MDNEEKDQGAIENRLKAKKKLYCGFMKKKNYIVVQKGKNDSAWNCV